jgi:phosphoribosylanthranilate isomerase
MNRVRVKFCGVTRAEDALYAARLGVDAIGMVFYAGSPRAVSVVQAQAMVEVLPPFLSKVALFVNASKQDIDAVLSCVRPDILQFHGEEPPEECRRHGLPYIKAIRMRADIDLHHEAGRYHDASALLLDAYREGMHGGTGTAFDWALAPQSVSKPIILAGGLTPDNVAAAIRQVRPYAVDVSGGIEAAKGVKDPSKMQAFMYEVDRGSR